LKFFVHLEDVKNILAFFLGHGVYEPTTFTVTGELQQLQENGNQDGKYAKYVAGQRTYDKEPERRDRSARQAASRWDTTAMIDCAPAEARQLAIISSNSCYRC